MAELDSFAEQIVSKGLTQADMAVAMLWYRDRHEGTISASAHELAGLLHSTACFSKVNISRLAAQLSRHPDVVRGESPGTYRIRAGSRAQLDEAYAPFVNRKRVHLSDSVISRSQFENQRKPWRDLVAEINGCYDHGFYDGAAVLSRRLVETLIIAAFKAKNAEAAIKTPSGDNKMLDGLIAVLLSGTPIKLTKSAKPALAPVKLVGDNAAHSLNHITTKQDIDGVSPHVRLLISEFLAVIDGK